MSGLPNKGLSREKLKSDKWVSATEDKTEGRAASV